MIAERENVRIQATVEEYIDLYGRHPILRVLQDERDGNEHAR
jgi:hypothetical protein